MSNLLKAFLQSFMLAVWLITIAYLIYGSISLVEIIVGLVSICVLFGSYRFFYLSNK